jgi:hypothetical protein
MPQRTANRRRPSRPHERLWVNHTGDVSYNVDINLEDAWLESLNALEAFDLRSICEGHPRGTEAQGGAHPHIHLR